MSGKAIRIRGIVQGVGFRPMVWRLARQYGLQGEVWNDGLGVMIHAYGDSKGLDTFIRELPLHKPPLARLDSLEVQALDGQPPSNGFRIGASQNNAIETPVTADAATCTACLDDIADPSNRRYRYPFTHCTHCGPRLSIIRQVPYDRCYTSMAAFTQCALCQQEYDDPADRRFHAQANCCPDCGPKVWLENSHGPMLVNDPIKQAADLIRQGFIVAIKGLGGFHLACDATDAVAVNRLRERKQRYAKPFALMAKDVGMIARYAKLTEAEISVLHDKAAPVLLLIAKGEKLASAVAPDDDKLGFMLPYTPLHSLLLQDMAQPMVLTSGNISDEPQCTDNGEAKEKLAGIADYFLLHDRIIVNRLDDSVLRLLAGKPRLLRRARGYSPEALVLPAGFAQAGNVLAMGAELKNTFCLLKQGQAVLSQHIGDLENIAVQQDYRQALALYQRLYGFRPECIAVDCHPGYLSTQYGQTLAAAESAVLVQVPHHHAHLAACLAEYSVALDAPPVLAAIFDGLGMGDDGGLWGGEFLLGDYRSCKRLGHFQPIALPGGTQAMREPWRNTYAQLRQYFDLPALLYDYANVGIMQLLAGKPLALLDTMIAKNINAPLSSSCGRWFDAFAAALGLHGDYIDYEGQAAIALEILATPVYSSEHAYPRAYAINDDAGLVVLSWQGLWQAVLDDLKQGVGKALIAARIHHSLAGATADLLCRFSDQTGIGRIVLSGGVFQNRLLLETVTLQLQQSGKTVWSPVQYPMNDGGLALGQAVVAGALAIG